MNEVGSCRAGLAEEGYMRGLNFNFTEIAFIFVLLFVAITVHEASHALAAHLLGDSTAKRLGRLTLNPIAHMDPLGTIMLLMTIVGGFGIGWGKPVPVNPYNLRGNPKTSMALVSAAGPASNLALAGLLAVLLRMGMLPDISLVLEAVLFTVQICVVLAVFNLIPLPPLDGFSVLLGLLPDRQARSWARLGNYGPGLLMAVILGGYMLHINFLGFILNPPVRFILGLLLGRGIF